jgi:hypothetical protein
MKSIHRKPLFSGPWASREFVAVLAIQDERTLFGKIRKVEVQIIECYSITIGSLVSEISSF